MKILHNRIYAKFNTISYIDDYSEFQLPDKRHEMIRYWGSINNWLYGFRHVVSNKRVHYYCLSSKVSDRHNIISQFHLSPMITDHKYTKCNRNIK